MPASRRPFDRHGTEWEICGWRLLGLLGPSHCAHRAISGRGARTARLPDRNGDRPLPAVHDGESTRVSAILSLVVSEASAGLETHGQAVPGRRPQGMMVPVSPGE